MRAQKGFSLVGIMISLVIGLFLLTGVIEVYSGNKQTYRVANASARIQENARFATELLARDLRMAGYQGCAGETRTLVNTLNDTSSFLYDFGNAIYGFEATSANAWVPTLDTSLTGSSPLGGRDIVAVRGTFDAGVPIIGQPSDPTDCTSASSYTADLKVTSTSGFSDFDIVIAGNCSRASIFQITNLNVGENVVHNTGVGAPGNATKNLGACYAGDGELSLIATRTFFIRNNPAGVPALYRKVGNASAEELLDGVEDMQILYGRDADGDGSSDQFIRANDVTDWNPIASVRISLLLRSTEDNLTTQIQPYVYNSANVTPNDHRLRRVFTTTIALRNRLP